MRPRPRITGKAKRGPSPDTQTKLRLPYKEHGEMFGVVLKLHGTDQIRAACEDGIERMCRIPGKLKKRIWMREGDVIIVRLWDFQPSKADVVWRYMPMQTDRLKRMNLLGKLPV